MKIEIQEGDVVFKRAVNGWIIHRIGYDEGEFMETYIVEDISDEPIDALWSAFQEVTN